MSRFYEDLYISWIILFSEISRTIGIFHADFFKKLHVLASKFHAQKIEFFHAKRFMITHRILDQ